jgi:hypothetical protein
MAISFNGGGNPTDLSQIIDKLYHIMLYRVHSPDQDWSSHKIVLITFCFRLDMTHKL